MSWIDAPETTARSKTLATQLKNALGYAKRLRFEFLSLLPKHGVGVELGVARGAHSEQILIHAEPAFLYSIDMYAGDRNHDVAQYKLALSVLDRYRSHNSLLRMRFDEALDLFPDHYFDFIYVDGYAHTGEENGSTFENWYPKLKPGGVFCGDDYHDQWPLVVEAVNSFVAKHELDLLIFNTRDHFSTWATLKPHPSPQRMELILERAVEAVRTTMGLNAG